MFEIKNYPDFSWSLSRHKTLMECPRQYAYQYYVSHNGWLKTASDLAKQAYRLKQLTSLEMLFGSIVHEVIESVIEQYRFDGTWSEEAVLTERVRQALNNGFIDSTRRFNEWMTRPKKLTMFHELYYGDDKHQLPQEKINKIQSRLHVAIKHFLQSQSWVDITTNPNTAIYEAERFHHLYVGRLKVFIVMDLVYRDQTNNQWIIVDWKTGKQSEEDPYQLALYALYLQQAFQIEDINQITIRNEYLLEGETKDHKLDPITLEKVQELMGTSVDRMLDYLEDRRANKPLPIDKFPQTSNLNACKRCNFQEFCFG